MGLRDLILKKILISFFILWLVASINFVVFYYRGGTFTAIPRRAPPQVGELLSESYGFGDPPLVQYLKYLKSLFTFGFIPPYLGWSIYHNEYVAQGLSWRLPITLLLLGSAFIISFSIGILIGMFSAFKRGSKVDAIAVSSSIVTWCVPSYVLQLLSLVLFGVILEDWYGIHILPTTFNPPAFVSRDFAYWIQVYSQLTLPIITLALASFGYWALMTRSLLLGETAKEYIVTARAKGLSERAILSKHVFRCIRPQVFTMIATSLPPLITGSVLTEYIFGIEGIGKYMFYISWLPNYMIVVQVNTVVIQAVFFLYATLMVVCNFIADVTYGALDPRIRLGASYRKR